MKNHQQIERLQEAVNRLIGGILPFAILGRDLKAFDPANPTITPIDVDDRALRRAWDAVQFATDNAPEHEKPLPFLFDDQTRAVLHEWGLDRSDLAAQVYFLTQIVATQTKQLRSWETQEAIRDMQDRERETGGA